MTSSPQKELRAEIQLRNGSKSFVSETENEMQAVTIERVRTSSVIQQVSDYDETEAASNRRGSG